MANAYSILHNYDQPLYNPDFGLINKALSSKQQKLDLNREKLQSKLDQFGSLDIYRGIDKEYAEERMDKIVDVANKYAHKDLSNNYLTRALSTNMDQYLDDKVKTSIVSTKKFKAQMQEWEEAKENKEKEYSEVNKNFAMQQALPWLNSKKVGEDYKGDAGFIPYVDVNKKFNEKAPTIAEKIGAEWVELGNGRGQFRDKITKEKVGRGRLHQALQTLKSPDVKRQMQINAWNRYGGMSEENLKKSYESYYTPKIEKLNKKIKSYKDTIEKTDNTYIKNDAKKALQAVQAEKQSLDAVSDYDNMQSKEQAYTMLYNNQFDDNYLNTYSFGERVTERAVHEADVENSEHKIKLQNSQTKRMNAQTNRMEFLSEQKGSDGTVSGPGGRSYSDENDNEVPDHQEGTVSDGTNAKEYGEGAGNADAKVTLLRKMEDKAVNNLINSIDGVDSRKDVYEITKDMTIDQLTKDSLEINVPGEGSKIVDFSDGKNASLRAKLVNYMKVYKQNTDNREKVNNIYQTRVDGVIQSLGKTFLARKNGESIDVSGSELPTFNAWYKKTEDGYVKHYQEPGDGLSYKDLLVKKQEEGLSEEESFNLQAYTYSKLIDDPDISEAVKNDLEGRYKTKFNSKLADPSSDKVTPGLELSQKHRPEDIGEKPGAMYSSTYFSDLNDGDLEGNEVYGNLTETVGNMNVMINRSIDLTGERSHPVFDRRTFGEDDAYHPTLIQLAEAQSGVNFDKNENIHIERELKDGGVGNTFKITGILEGSEISRSIEGIKQSDLERNGVDYQEFEKPLFTLDSSPIELSSYNSGRDKGAIGKNTIRQTEQLDKKAEELDTGVSGDTPYQDKVDYFRKMFKEGGLDFKIEPDKKQGTMYFTMSYNGDEMYKQDMGVNSIKDIDVLKSMSLTDIKAKMANAYIGKKILGINENNTEDLPTTSGF